MKIDEVLRDRFGSPIVNVSSNAVCGAKDMLAKTIKTVGAIAVTAMAVDWLTKK